MRALRVIVGLSLALVVSTINGVSGIGYVVGGEFEVSMQAAVGNEAMNDTRWENQDDEAQSKISPRDGLSALSLIADSKFGRFGLFLQVFCLLQFIGGLIVAFSHKARITAFTFLILVALIGIAVEIIGARYSSAWGVTNVFGVMISVMLVPVAFYLFRATHRKNATQEVT